MLKELIEKQRTYTNHFFETFDLKEVEKLMQLLINTQGIIFFTGVGKSGMIAKKIAVTMASTGTRALFMSPIDALHGDVGMVSSLDCFIVFSKSGESDELINLIPAIKNKGAKVIGVVCNAQSRLNTLCDFILHLPFQAELCPFDLAPTMSTTYQLLLGDLITVALMKHKKFTLDEYASNHPAGRIGKRIIMKVKDLMLSGTKIPVCNPSDILSEVLLELTDKRCGCLVIVDMHKKIRGIFTDGDLRRSLQKYREEVLKMRMDELMTENVKTINSHTLAWDALKLMEANPKQRLSVLPVVDEEENIVGLLHIHDIIQSGI